jgi:hypothetical protein
MTLSRTRARGRNPQVGAFLGLYQPDRLALYVRNFKGMDHRSGGSIPPIQNN